MKSQPPTPKTWKTKRSTLSNPSANRFASSARARSSHRCNGRLRFGASQRKLGELHNVSHLPLSDRRQTHIKQRHVSDRKFEAAFENPTKIINCVNNHDPSGSSITLTWPATTRQPSLQRTHVWVWRPILPGAVLRRKSVEATA
jgi:hypothetical protein